MSSFRLPISASSPAAYTGQFSISTIYWYNPITIGDTVSVQDTSGKLIWQGRCEAANQSQVFNFIPFSTDGININQISSGTLFIYPAGI